MFGQAHGQSYDDSSIDRVIAGYALMRLSYVSVEFILMKMTASALTIT